MKEFSVNIREKLARMDFVVITCAVAMTALSILVLWGGAADLKNGMNKVMVQCIASLLGIALMLLIALIDYDALISKLEIFFFAMSIALIVIVMVANIGATTDTNHNWIDIPGIPFHIQPAEFVKISFIITFSRHIDRVRANINHIKNVLMLMLHAGIIIGLIMLTGDLGTVLVYAFVVLVMLFAGGLSLWYFAAFFLIIGVAFPFLWSHMREYQQLRILVGFEPELDPTYIGYQPLMSKQAIIAGGFRGAGLTGGSQFAKIPAAHSDFLFAVLAEKLGFFGTFTYIVLMSILIIRLLLIARRARKDYSALICMGVIAILIAQTLENIGMCLATLPVVGITLPFFSYGGSSMLTMYICMGVIQSICTHNQKYYFEREPASQSDYHV